MDLSPHFTSLFFAHNLNGCVLRESVQERTILSQVLSLGLESPSVSEERWPLDTLLTTVIFWSGAELNVFSCLPQAVLVAFQKFRNI